MTDQPELPLYQCHKQVRALKIHELSGMMMDADGSFVWMTPAEPEYRHRRIRLSRQFLMKHDPQVGGYFVVYDDLYQSFSPAKAFEEGYTRLITKAETAEIIPANLSERGANIVRTWNDWAPKHRGMVAQRAKSGEAIRLIITPLPQPGSLDFDAPIAMNATLETVDIRPRYTDPEGGKQSVRWECEGIVLTEWAEFGR